MALVISLTSGYTFTATDTLTVGKLNLMFSDGYATVESGTISTNDIAAEAVTLAKQADLARGSIITGQTASNRPTALDAKTDTYILVGDGTDLNSVEMTGDATIANTGVVTVANQLTVATQWDADDTTFPEKTALADADWFIIEDSEASWAKKKVSRASVIAAYPTRIKADLVVKNNAGTPDTQIDVDATELSVTNSTGSTSLISDVDVTIDATGSGANGIDTGSLAASTMYYVWVIWNGTTTAGLVSTSSTAPTLPTGYTHKRLVGEVYSDGSVHFTKVNREDDEVWFEDPQAVYTTQTLTTSYVQHALPSTVPAGAVALTLETTSDASGTGNCQCVSPDSTTRFEVTSNALHASGANRNVGPTAGYFSQQHRMKHLGATSVYARVNNNGNLTNQCLHVWGYRLER